MRNRTIATTILLSLPAGAMADVTLGDPFSQGWSQGQHAARSLDVVLSEILGNTSGSDWEFIELCNVSSSPIDITGWSVELWDSDTGGTYGGADGSSPYRVAGSITLAPGQTYTFGNDLAIAGYPQPPFGFDTGLPANAVENSSYTAILVNASGGVIDSVFVTDGGAGDSANRAGSPITPSMTVGPDGANLPAGFARTDVVGGHVLLNFDTTLLADGTIVGGTPGICQIPTPGATTLLACGSLLTLRPRRR